MEHLSDACTYKVGDHFVNDFEAASPKGLYIFPFDQITRS